MKPMNFQETGCGVSPSGCWLRLQNGEASAWPLAAPSGSEDLQNP